ncbi:hypothetical protein ACFVYP_10340 [Kitasatospora sp. NPDC058201]|uniref:hypothetical protein n=1 Tax=unclassified Kitasatospora TaxID=2633591 RepID=UPI00365AF260
MTTAMSNLTIDTDATPTGFFAPSGPAWEKALQGVEEMLARSRRLWETRQKLEQRRFHAVGGAR